MHMLEDHVTLRVHFCILHLSLTVFVADYVFILRCVEK